jgi:hypothetical protein
MSDRALLDDLIAKLREMEEQLAMAQLETTRQSLLESRVKHLLLLARHVRLGLEKMMPPSNAPTQPGGELRP